MQGPPNPHGPLFRSTCPWSDRPGAFCIRMGLAPQTPAAPSDRVFLFSTQSIRKRFYSLELPLVAYREGPLAVASRLGRTRATSLEVGPWSGSRSPDQGLFCWSSPPLPRRIPRICSGRHIVRNCSCFSKAPPTESACLAAQDNGRSKSALICDVMEIWLKEHGYLK